jgi:hypothetical protein
MTFGPTCGHKGDHVRGFDAHSPYAMMLYVYLAAIPFALLQTVRRGIMEREFRAQMKAVSQPVGRTLLWFGVLSTALLLLRCAWLFLKESELLDDDVNGCVNQWDCPKIFVSALNRASTFTHFVAFTLLGACRRWS